MNNICWTKNASSSELIWISNDQRFNFCFAVLITAFVHLWIGIYGLAFLLSPNSNNPPPFRSWKIHKVISILNTICLLIIIAAGLIGLIFEQIYPETNNNSREFLESQFVFGSVSLVWLFQLVAYFFRSELPLTKHYLFISIFAIINYAILFIDLHTRFSAQHSFITLNSIVIICAQCSSTLLLILRFCVRNYHQSLRSISTDRLINDLNATQIELGNGADDANYLSRLFFYWTSPLLAKGALQQLNSIHDLFLLPSELSIDKVNQTFTKSRYDLKTGTERKLISRLFDSFGLHYLLLGVLKFIGDNLNFVGPVLLHELVEFVTDKTDTETEWHGFAYAGGMFAAAFVSAVCSWHYNYGMTVVSLKMRASTQSALYAKLCAVSLAQLSQNGFGSGEIMNHLSTDVDRICGFCPSFHGFWSLPIQLIVAMYLIYREIGISFLTVVVIAILLVPINKWITVKLGELSTKMMKAKDKRVRMVTEVLFGIRTIKLSNWQDNFTDRIRTLRETELKYLKGRKYLDAVCVYLWASAPVFISISIFVTYTLMGHALTPAKAFTCLALVNILIMPLNAFPWTLNGLIEAWVSAKRLQRFFDLDEVEPTVLISDSPESVLSLHEASYCWCKGKDEENSSNTLRDISISVEKGKLIGVIGSVGSAKSSLLLGILNELDLVSGHVSLEGTQTVDEGMAYCAQEPWLQQGTVRDNILFGTTHYDQEHYLKVIAACALEHDLQQMPKGDQTELSEQGVTLSGGQKARIALARAVYQKKDVYLLDDPLSAVNGKVGRHIWEQCIVALLRNEMHKTVIICTHHVQYLMEADLVLRLENGMVQDIGIPSDVLPPLIIPESKSTSMKDSNDDSHVHRLLTNENCEPVLMADEEKEVGHVQLKVYGVYARAAGTLLSSVVMLSLLMMQISQNMTDWWLAHWVQMATPHNRTVNGTRLIYNALNLYCLAARAPVMLLNMVEQNFDTNSNSEIHVLLNTYDQSERNNSIDNTYYVSVYAGLAALNTLFTLLRAFLFAYAGIVAARKLHSDLLVKILKVIGTLIIMCYALPWFIVVVFACSLIYYWIQVLDFVTRANVCRLVFTVFTVDSLFHLVNLWCRLQFRNKVLAFQKYFRYSNSELKRLSNMSLSPVYSHLTDTVNGLATIRAFKAVPRLLMNY